MRFCLRVFFRLCKVRVYGLEKGKSFDGPVIYFSNHLSTLDALILYAFLPNEPFFAVSKEDAREPKNRFFLRKRGLKLFKPLEPTSVKTVLERIKKGRSVVVFAEGRMSEEGGLLKIYETAGFMADKLSVPLVPVWITGAQYSVFSPSKGELPRRLFPRIRVTVQKPIPFKVSPEKHRDRNYVSNELYRMLLDLSFKSRYYPENSLFYELMKTAKVNAKTGLFQRPDFVEDTNRVPHTYKKIIIKSFIYGRYLKKFVEQQETCGIMLPNSIDNLTILLGLMAYERVPAMMNYSSGVQNILSAMKTAEVKTVITSNSFVKSMGLQEVVDALQEAGIKVISLKEVKRQVLTRTYFKAWLSYKFKYVPHKKSGDKKGVILFTSGSEGVPKAVVLSHQNLTANIFQTCSMVHISAKDLLFNALPMFHSFGLTVGTLFPLICGGRLFLFPSPLRYREVAELCYSTGATMLFGTDTFLSGYERVGHPFDFHKMRYVMGGAEPVKKETRDRWAEKFGIRLFEGYGATETSPILSLNNHIFCRYGSIGQIVPFVEHRIKPVDGVENGGVLEVKGPNIMMGYMFADNPGVLVPPKDGWYETGDVVELDEDGFLFIRARLKRFAKVAGEMVSLPQVEKIAETVYGGKYNFAAVAVPHASKGEQIVLVSTYKRAKLDKFTAYTKENGYSELANPRIIVYRDEIPVLGTGKRNYIALTKDVIEELNIKK